MDGKETQVKNLKLRFVFGLLEHTVDEALPLTLQWLAILKSLILASYGKMGKNTALYKKRLK